MTKVAVIGSPRLRRRISERLRHGGMQVEHVRLGARKHRTTDDAASAVSQASAPDIVVLDMASPSRRTKAHFLGEAPLLVLAPDDLSQWGRVRPLLGHRLSDFVRVHLVENEAEVDDQAGEEVVERARLLLERAARFTSRSAPQAEQPGAAWAESRAAPDRLGWHHPQSGRLDARRAAEFFGVSQASLAQTLGASRAALHKTPDARSLQKGLRPWHLAATSLLDLVGTLEAARVWLHAPNPDLEGHVPLALMLAGEAEVVAALLRDALVGQPS